MIQRRLLPLLAAAALLCATAAQAEPHNSKIKHVLLISVDGMHAIEFANCSQGIASVNGGEPYCPNLARLADHAVNYVSASTSRPSDSFPGLTALITGGTPRSTGTYYDVSYDRSLSPPVKDTSAGVVAGPCPEVIGTQVGFDESIDVDSSRLDGGGGIDPNFLPRDPRHGCAPVYPHNFLRVNTIFEVVKAAGGYTAWSDKHRAYDFVLGPSGAGVNDLFSPEIASNPVGLTVPPYEVANCHTLPDPNPSGDWTSSFEDIKCYDTIKVQAILNEIDGKTHDGMSSAPVPTLFGMNFQAVSIGQKLVEKSIGVTGGYADALATPSPALLGEIEFVDQSIGRMADELKRHGLFESTLIIVTAKHGQSALDPNRILRIPADNAALTSPAAFLPGTLVAQALEDDISLLWLTDQSQTTSAALSLSQNINLVGGGEVFAGNSLKLMFADPLKDPRTPDIIVQPNVGVVYTGGTKKISEHGGFSHDDTNVLMLVSSPALPRKTYTGSVETRQVPLTILGALGLNPMQLQAVQIEGGRRCQAFPSKPDSGLLLGAAQAPFSPDFSDFRPRYRPANALTAPGTLVTGLSPAPCLRLLPGRNLSCGRGFDAPKQLDTDAARIR